MPRFIVLGTVEDTAKRPIASARLELSWADTTRDSRVDEVGQIRTFATTETIMEVVADSVGGFIACGIPYSRVIAARAVMPTGHAATGTTRISARPDDVSRRMANDDLRGMRLVVRP